MKQSDEQSSEKVAPIDSCAAPSWCGTDCLGSNGPGLDARRGTDYVVGMHTELYCSVGCRDTAWPSLSYLPPDFGSDTFERIGGRWARRHQLDRNDDSVRSKP